MAEPVVFDTWAWVEVLNGSPAGLRLRKKYLDNDDIPVYTVDVTLAELSIRMSADGKDEHIPTAVHTVFEASTSVLPIDGDDAVKAGPLRRELRRQTKKDASLVDAVVLSVARNRGAVVVSCDTAFKGQPDVICEE